MDAKEIKGGVYRLPVKNGYFEIVVSTDDEYPGIDIEFRPNTEPDHPVYSGPRILFEQENYDDPDDPSEKKYGEIHAYVWGDPDGEDRSEKIVFDPTGKEAAHHEP